MQNWKKMKFPIFQRHTKFIILVTFKHAALIGLPLLHFFLLTGGQAVGFMLFGGQ